MKPEELYSNVAKLLGVKITPEVGAQLSDAIKNRALLENCASHDFEPKSATGNALLAGFSCKNCGGAVRAVEKRWYEAGVRHASGTRVSPQLRAEPSL